MGRSASEISPAPERPASTQLHGPVVIDSPPRVVGYLPRVTLRVDEHCRVAAPEGLARFACDPRAGGARLLDHAVHLGGRAGVVGGGDPAPASTVGDAAVLGELFPVPERHDHASGLEEDDVVVGAGPGRPAERLVEPPRPREIAHAERDQADALLHYCGDSPGPCSRRKRWNSRAIESPEGRSPSGVSDSSICCSRRSTSARTSGSAATASSSLRSYSTLASSSPLRSRSTSSRPSIRRISASEAFGLGTAAT